MSEDYNRVVILSQTAPNFSPYLNNRISCSRYTWFDLLPRSVFHQFQNVTLLYFLLISIFELIPSPPEYSTIVPLCLLVCFTLIQDAFHTAQSKKLDQELNGSCFSVWNGKEFGPMRCEKILVGHIIRVNEGQASPADLLILFSDNHDGSFFVDSNEMQGSADMNTGQAVYDTQELLQQDYIEAVRDKLEGKVRFPEPNSDHSSFHGKLNLKKHPKGIELHQQNMLLRSATLHGTVFVIGIVLYAGLETKIYSTVKPQRKKSSSFDTKLSYFLLFLIVVHVTLVACCTVSQYLLDPCMHGLSSPTLMSNIRFFIVQFSNTIPITLLIYLQIVHWLQTIAIRYQMHKQCRFNNTEVNETLGKIEYVVANTSGTITENSFQAIVCMVGFLPYYREEAEARPPTQPDESLFEQVPKACSGASMSDLHKQMMTHDTKEYFLSMVLCNHIAPSVQNDLKAYGCSKEDQALMDTCKEFGVSLISRNSHKVLVEYCAKLLSYDVIAFNQGKNTRILVQVGAGLWRLYVRGTEEKLVTGLDLEGNCREELLQKIAYFKAKGLRLFLLGSADFSGKDLERISGKISNAKSFPTKTELRMEKIFRKLETRLNYLGLCGVEDSIIADTEIALQGIINAGIKLWVTSSEGKIPTMATCRKAGIFPKYMPLLFLSHLTSSASCIKKLTKAISQHIFCENVPEPSQVLTILEYKTSKAGDFAAEVNVSEILSPSVNTYNRMHEEARLAQQITLGEDKLTKLLEKGYNWKQVKFAVVIDRITWRTAKSHPVAMKLLTCLLFAAETVWFYKMLGPDKAEVVNLLRKNLKFSPNVLAVGDGEGDIPMIQAASVGVIVQKQRNQIASNRADVVLEHFALIRDLVLFHGFWNISRNSTVVLLFVYKNMMLVVVGVLYIKHSNFLSSNGIDVYFFLFYNIFLTSFPLVTLGTEDQNYTKTQILRRSSLYFIGISTSELNPLLIASCLLSSVVDGLIIFSLISLVLNKSLLNSQGFTENYDLFGALVFVIASLTALLEISLKVHTYTALFIGANAMSLGLLIAVVFIRGTKITSDIFGVSYQIFNSPIIVITILTMPFVCIVANTVISNVFQILIKKHPINRLKEFQENLGMVFHKSSASDETEKDIYDMNKYTMRFYSLYIEKAYQENYITSNLKYLRIVILLSSIGFACSTIVDPLINQYTVAYIGFRSSIAFVFILSAAIAWTNKFHRHYRSYTLILIICSLICKVAIEIIFVQPSVLLAAIVPSITFIFFNVDWIKITFINIASLFLCVVIIFAKSQNAVPIIGFLQIFSILLSILITSALLARTLEKIKRQEFKLLRLQEVTYEKTQRILSFLLPSFVKKRVKDGVRYIAEDQGTVTVIFCDIVDFDIICAEYSPTELTTFLDFFFQKLDNQCNIYGVSKIETVGKTYMACAGLRDSEDELENSLRFVSHAKRCLNLGLAIIEETCKFSMKNGRKLEVKIGIHSGPVTAGVVGHHKPQFSLVGDTVNTASRMCSTLESGNSIQISAETYSMINDIGSIKFQPTRVNAKGKGWLKTYTFSANSMNEFWNFLEEATFYRNSSVLTSAVHTEKTLSKSGTKDKGVMAFLDESFRSDTVFLEGARWYQCKFSENNKEMRFRIDRLEDNKQVMQLGIIVSLVTFTLIIVLNVVMESQNPRSPAISNTALGLRSLSLVFLLVIVILYKKIYKSRAFPVCYLMVLSNMLAASLVEYFGEEGNMDLMTVEVMYIVLLLNHASGLSFRGIVWSTPLMLGPYIAVLAFIQVDFGFAVNLVFVIGFTLINSSAVYSRETQLRNYFNLKALTEKDIGKTEKLLVHMMPPHALENMKNNRSITDTLCDVTLLYADIVGFTAWSADKSPIEVVDMLSRLFTRFDKLCVIHKVYKVHTIGDCYVVMSYFDSKNRDPKNECFSVISMAMSMVSVINRINLEQNTNLKMRIGIHTGNVIAGIIGTNIVRYDIYGPDVLIANKMESCGEAGKINVSDATKNMVSDDDHGRFEFTLNKEIEFKTIGKKYTSYFLSSST